MILKILAMSAQLGLGTSWASHLAPRQNNFQDQCSRFNPADAGIANATVTNHAFIAGGTSLNLTGNDICGQTSQAVPVDLCRVSLQISTSNRSGVVAEVWMPQNWNGRIVTTGNGGLAGCGYLKPIHLISTAILSTQSRYRLCIHCLYGE